MSTQASPEAAADVLHSLQQFLREASLGQETTIARDPGHRVKFHWPPHPVSYSFHVLATDWTGSGILSVHGEDFPIQIARTSQGVFGRCEGLWLEARGEGEAEMLDNLRDSAQPLFRRQHAMSRCLGRTGRFTGHVRDLEPWELLRLLYCEDRDVANEARIEIETHASLRVFTPALIEILRDQRHPNRRSAQWCVLDLFEDLPSFAATPVQEEDALDSVKQLIWTAPDDYARTIYKAGVVLGGHLPHLTGGKMLLECLYAPSKIGRRSAIHGLFHTVEWAPESREDVVAALREAALRDPEPLLVRFASLMANDIENGDTDHIQEPVFPDEA